MTYLREVGGEIVEEVTVYCPMGKHLWEASGPHYTEGEWANCGDCIDAEDEADDKILAAHGVTPEMISEAAAKVKTALGLSVNCRNVWCALVGKCECPAAPSDRSER